MSGGLFRFFFFLSVSYRLILLPITFSLFFFSFFFLFTLHSMNTKIVKSLSFNKKTDNKTNQKGFLSKLGSPFTTQSQPATPVGSPPHSHSKLPEQTQANGSTLEEKQLFEEIRQCRVALDHFLNSNINEAEAILKPHYKDSMYFSLGYSFILYLKSVMTFQEDDIEATLGVLKHTIQLAGNLRKKESGWLGSVTSWVKGTTLEDVKSMTVVERHAVRFHNIIDRQWTSETYCSIVFFFFSVRNWSMPKLICSRHYSALSTMKVSCHSFERV